MILEISQFLSATNHIHSHEDCVCDWLDYASVYIFDSIKITCMFYWKRAKSCDCDLHLHDHVFPTYVLPKPTEHFPGLLFAANICNQNAKLIFAYVVYENNNNQAFLYKNVFFFCVNHLKNKKNSWHQDFLHKGWKLWCEGLWVPFVSIIHSYACNFSIQYGLPNVRASIYTTGNLQSCCPKNSWHHQGKAEMHTFGRVITADHCIK